MKVSFQQNFNGRLNSSTRRRSHVIVTSDHGELFGDEIAEEIFGHDPSDVRVQFHEKLFRNPFHNG